ncbi:MAG: hypothetical protein O9322_09625 [Beijerinckiaceae bacterium]|nr:hypothetical protein [Beijerinckiaceae bacterium]MCZ8299592.1 hypothetical protein [Beijerinckiaceae bacterium]
MVALEALYSDLLIALTQSTAFRWGLAAAVSLWIWLIGKAGTPWRVAALLSPFLAAAILEVLDQFIVGPGSGPQSGWLYFYLHSQAAFHRLISLDGAVFLVLALLFGFIHRFSLAVLLCLATAIYLRYAIYGASEVLLSGAVARWLFVVMPTVLIAILGLYSLGATLRLITAVRQVRNGDDDDRY